MGRRHARFPEDLGDRRRRDSLTDTSELADDALVAPTRILTRKTKHQLTDLLRDRGPTRWPSGVGPPFPYKLAMPAKQRVRANEERRPARPAKQPAGRSQEHPVSLLQPWTSDLAAKNPELVAQHHDLELLELTRAQTQRRDCQRTPKQQIQQRHEQAAASLHPNPKKPTLRLRTRLGAPSRAPYGITYPTGARDGARLDRLEQLVVAGGVAADRVSGDGDLHVVTGRAEAVADVVRDLVVGH